MGGVLLGTATIAGFSMWLALAEVLGEVHWSAVVLAAGWALFVLTLDRWLVASACGVHWHRRLAALLPRLLIACFFGLVIAEPLVLRIFATAVEEQVRDDREQELAALRGRLVTCNPVPDKDSSAAAGARPPDCAAEHVFSFQTNPGALAAELAALRLDADTLRSSVDEDTRRLNELNEVARDECTGVSGPGLSGVAGAGTDCRRQRRLADEYAATHPIQENAAKLAALTARVSDLEGRVSTARGDYERERDTKITQRVDERRANQGAIGLLERFRALDALTGHDEFLRTAVLVVRGFFILIDCLPVLVKLFGGTTSYDRAVDLRLSASLASFAKGEQARSAAQSSARVAREKRAATRARQEDAEIELDERERAAAVEVAKQGRVNELYERFLHPRHRTASDDGPADGDASGPDASGPRPDDADGPHGNGQPPR